MSFKEDKYLIVYQNYYIFIKRLIGKINNIPSPQRPLVFTQNALQGDIVGEKKHIFTS